MERLYATFYLLAIVMFALSVTVCERLSQNVHDIDLYYGPRSNVNMPMEKSYATLYLFAIAIFAPSVTICKIFAGKMCMTLKLTFRMGKGQIKICRSKVHMRLPVLAIAMFVQSVTVGKIIMYELPMYSI